MSENPYHPPPDYPPRGTAPGQLSEEHRRRLQQTSPVPDPDFWPVAFTSVGLLLLASTLLSLWLLPLLFALLMGILRVCLVYSTRARSGLPPLEALTLLVTSTLVSAGILVVAASLSAIVIYILRSAAGLPEAVWLTAGSLMAIFALATVAYFLSIGWAKS